MLINLAVFIHSQDNHSKQIMIESDILFIYLCLS